MRQKENDMLDVENATNNCLNNESSKKCYGLEDIIIKVQGRTL